MKIYNLFPRNYSTIKEMQEKIKTIKDLGFDTIWINPIQKAGDVEVKDVVDKLTGKKIKSRWKYLFYVFK